MLSFGPVDPRGLCFRDREHAGRALAAVLGDLRGRDVVVLALPRGGVPVAIEVARALEAPLDVFVVRKLGVPGHEELAMGAIASGGVVIVNRPVIEAIGLGRAEVEQVVARERVELARRERAYRGGHGPLDVAGRTAIVIDDGLATGSSMAAAAEALRRRAPAHLVVAVPVGSPQACWALRKLADEVVCLDAPARLRAVGEFYEDFRQLSDEDVRRLLAAAEAARKLAHPKDGAREEEEEVGAREELELVLDGHGVEGELIVPSGARGLVLFAHGSGLSDRSPRNRQVATSLGWAGLATLLFDLLDEREARRRELVFDVELLAMRLVAVTRWARSEPALERLGVGYFGAFTGAAAALLAAADQGAEIRAVVSRGGRPDLAAGRLAEVRAPTLLIVGGADREVLELNRRAAAALRCPHELAVVERAGHLFEEPGALEQVAHLASEWFARHLGPAPDSHAMGATA